MNDIKHQKHLDTYAKAIEARDGKRGILNTWYEWREGKVVYKGKEKVYEDLEYWRDLTRRVRALTVRVENMKPVSEWDD